MAWGILSAEDVLKVFVEWVDPDGLFVQQGLIVDTELAVSLGVAQVGPVCRFVAESVESVGVRQRFPGGRV